MVVIRFAGSRQMWTNENRGRYDRSKLRYPSDLTDAEWSVIGPLIPRAKRGGNKRTVDEREIVNGLMYILSTGCQWAAIPKDRGGWLCRDTVSVSISGASAGWVGVACRSRGIAEGGRSPTVAMPRERRRNSCCCL